MFLSLQIWCILLGNLFVLQIKEVFAPFFSGTSNQEHLDWFIKAFMLSFQRILLPPAGLAIHLSV